MKNIEFIINIWTILTLAIYLHVIFAVNINNESISNVINGN